MADILLSFGVAQGRADVDKIRDGLQKIIKEIEKNPPKVRVGLTVDSDALKNFKSELQKVINTVTMGNGAPITLNIDGLGKISAEAGKAAAAVKKVTEATNEYSRRAGTVNVERLLKTVTRMKTLLDNNKNSQDLQSYKTLYAQLTNLEAVLSRVDNESIDVEKAFAAIGVNGSKAINDAKEAMAAFVKELAYIGKSDDVVELFSIQMQQLDKSISSAKGNLRKWSAAKTGRTSGAYREMADAVAMLEDYRSQILAAGVGQTDLKAKIAACISTINRSSAAIKESNKNTASWKDRMRGLAEKFGSWLTVSQALMEAVRAAKKMVAIAVELDGAMTELKKVTDETDATYSRFLDNAAGRAKRVGATLAEVVNATTEFSRLGYSVSDASTLADAALVYKNIGDGIENVTAASESLISTMQAFGVEAKDIMSIVDKFNEVGNNFAISSTGIGEALLNSASALAAAGNTLDESIALITAANEIIQSPEKVGTAMKTLSMYIRAAKVEAEDAGVATDGMASSVSELRQQILDLTGNRVDIMESDTDFKSTYKIIEELAGIWRTLKETEQAAITELIGGGVRNANVINALMSNFTKAKEVLASSENSAGSALAENEKQMESIAGKITQFQAAFEELAHTVVNSDYIKGLIDIGTDLLTLLNNIIEALDGFGVALLAVGGTGLAAFIKNLD